MKKIKFLFAVVTIFTVSGSLLSFASANDNVAIDTNGITVTENNANQLEADAAAGWVLLWSKDVAALGGWDD